MTGKMNDFNQLFNKQLENQEMLLRKGMYDYVLENEKLPVDNVQLCSYHIQQLVSEIGEVLESDKRWKNFRNNKYDREQKQEEIADCFIVLMNIAMFSDMSADDLYNTINNKLDIVKYRINK